MFFGMFKVMIDFNGLVNNSGMLINKIKSIEGANKKYGNALSIGAGILK